MYTVLIVIDLLVAVALVCVILMQRTAQDGGGLTGGSSTMGGLFTARGSANLLTRTTAVLATIFIAMSLLLGVIAARQHQPKGIGSQLETTVQTETQVKPETEKPAVPSVPVSK